MKKIGVLALQGAVSEHIERLESLGNVNPCIVKYREDLEGLDGLIIPGGESTAIGLLLKNYGLTQPIRDKIQDGLAVWGTCAGMILLAKELSGGEPPHLQVMDICVRRNAYGRQLESFTTTVNLPEVSPSPIPLVFIRAPYVERAGADVEILLKVDGNIVACRQGRLLATSFHPELTTDNSFHAYFVNKVCP
ncbi:MAG TPA: pyridoxal 5'-phosphate synthase glutaminase subunit PdxT [Candidatus Avimonoglobus intestinipullorum]|uniref:Pyridoxal 5'-phosphate synthase subunit PdxT n=1 Tax=Candidatus Avimonoglobus intestinipullorum TaxID=2840699 RepID=A0A9D1LTP9_9FIRM|nr:pyridoxal 5'-phosphate synthase glutaminase subunit PdxT [Candidatus Avimonoglobus intestinipullorum]